MDCDPSDRQAAHRAAQLSYSYSLFAPGDATAPKVCRDFVRSVLLTLGHGRLVAAACLCTSELVTNVHLHTKGEAMMRLLVRPLLLRVSVFDESPALPVLRPLGQVECYGRGLTLVAETADRWGVAENRAGRHAKGVWFELAGGR
ncbi:ATP-binding protein [Streptomyces flavidovirens]|uniref:ATP-binding protein n=1 Tax=Streptomyces flavidovirens TaxID=67298 RepID=UPI003425779A